MASAMTGAGHQQISAIVTPNLWDDDLGPRDNEFHMISDKESEDDDASEEDFEVEESGDNPQSDTRAVYQSIEDEDPELVALDREVASLKATKAKAIPTHNAAKKLCHKDAQAGRKARSLRILLMFSRDPP